MKWVSWGYGNDCHNMGIRNLGITMFMIFVGFNIE